MDYLFNLPHQVAVEFCRLQDPEQGYSLTAARLSLLLDVNRKRIHGVRYYARLWGWTYAATRYRWPRLWKAVALWCSMNGKCLDHPLVERLPLRWQNWLDHTFRNQETVAGREKSTKTTKQVPSEPEETLSAASTREQRDSQRTDDAVRSAKRGPNDPEFADSQRTPPRTDDAPYDAATAHHIKKTKNRITEKPEVERDLRSRPAPRAAPSMPAAIGMMQRILHYTPNGCQQELVLAQVTDLGAWETVLRQTAEHGWRKTNVPGILDRYHEHLTGTSPDRGDRTPVAGDDSDPAVLFERNRQLARRALGLG